MCELEEDSQNSEHPLLRTSSKQETKPTSPTGTAEIDDLNYEYQISKLQANHTRGQSQVSWPSSRMPNSKPPLPSPNNPNKGHRRHRSAPSFMMGLELENSQNNEWDSEVAKYELAILRLKGSCPSKSDASHFSKHVFKISQVYIALANFHLTREHNYQGAIEAFSKAISMYRVARNGNMNDPEIASTYFQMGATHLKLCQNKEAAMCMEQAKRIRRVTLGNLHIETGNALHFHGHALCLLESTNKNLEKAKEALQEALEIRQKYLGKEHIEVARTLSLIGTVYKTMGQIEEALKIQQEVLDMKIVTLGTKYHSSVVATMVDIATLYRLKGCFNNALDIYKQILDIQFDINQVNQGVSSLMDLGMTLHTVGNIYKEIGEIEHAMSNYRQAAFMYLKAGIDQNHNCFLLLRKCMSSAIDDCSL